MKHLIACLLVLIVLSGCGGARSQSIANVAQAQTIILAKRPGQGAIHSLSVTGSGKLQGRAEITLLLDGQPHTTETLSGDVDFRWQSDWYADQAEIRYTPFSVAGGSLELTYTFSD